jgi:hypothetical protein
MNDPFQNDDTPKSVQSEDPKYGLEANVPATSSLSVVNSEGKGEGWSRPLKINELNKASINGQSSHPERTVLCVSISARWDRS